MCQLLTKQEKKVELQGQYFKLPPESRKQARVLAIEEGVSLSEWIAEAVQFKINSLSVKLELSKKSGSYPVRVSYDNKIHYSEDKADLVETLNEFIDRAENAKGVQNENKKSETSEF